MGVLDAARQLFSASHDTWDTLLATIGLDAAIVQYDAASGQVVLAVSIHGQARYLCFPTGRKLTRPELAALLAGEPIPNAPGHAPPVGQPMGDPG